MRSITATTSTCWAGYNKEQTVMLAAIRKLQTDRQATMACQDNLAFMRPLASGSMNLIVTSPPYNIGKSYESRSPLAEYVKAQAQVISECVRLLASTGSLCWQVGNHVQKGEIFPLDMVLYPVFQEHGLKLRNRIVWHFGHGLHCSKRLSGRYETILWLTKGDNYTFNVDPIRVPSKYPGKKYFKGPKAGQLSGNPLGKNPGDVWIFPNVKNNHVEKTAHPCQFPMELVERLVLSLTSPLLYSPIAMNAAMRTAFDMLGWSERRTRYWVTSDAKLIRKTMTMPPAQQKAEIEAAGLVPISSYNQTDMVKDRCAIEVQFGKYSFVAYDLFVKHLAFYVGDVIDVGVEILPMKELQSQMSSGVSYYEGELYNLIREGRGVPGVPLIMIGIAADTP